VLEPATLIGLGAIAVWLHLRYPKLRPSSLVRAILHVAVSFGAFALLPTLLTVLPLQLYVVLGVLIATLTYVLLSWVWLIARILHGLLGGTPRGGHPVVTEA